MVSEGDYYAPSRYYSKVLILVLVEDGFGALWLLFVRIVLQSVLILVLVEDGFGVKAQELIALAAMS